MDTPTGKAEFGRVFLNSAGQVVRVEVIGPGGKKIVHLQPNALVELPQQLAAAIAPPPDVQPTTAQVAHVAATEQIDKLPFKGHRRIMGELVDPQTVNHFYEGMTVDQIVTSRGFGTAVHELRKCGCYNAVELSLYAGALRAMQVVRFARREEARRAGTDNALRSLPDFISSNIWKGPPQARQKKGPQ